MFRKTAFRLSFLLLLTVCLAPVSKLHAQSTSPAPIVTGSDPIIGIGDPGDGGMDADVVTGGDPEPTGEDGHIVATALGATFVALRLS